MKVTDRCVVTLHYELMDEAGMSVESTNGKEPIAVLIGYRNVVYGLEQALQGRVAGERFEVTVPPEHGYGSRREGWTERFSKKHFPRPKLLKVGEQTVVRTPSGARWVTVAKVGSKVVDVDMNHPMAGRPLDYRVEVVDVREAGREELAHGHVHGPGGHSH